MLLPLYDSNPKHRIPFQYVTVALIAACVLVFLWQAGLDDRASRAAVLALGAIPAVITGNAQLAPELIWVSPETTLITSMFMHGGWLHLLGNMLYLWIVGDNVEDAMGHLKFLVFYVLCGIVAVFAHIALDPASQTPLVGASGAISGVMGAYLLLHPKARIHILFGFYIFFRVFPIPAWIVLSAWIALQFVNAAANSGTGGGVAWWAHIGGAIAGMILVPFFKHRDVPLFDRPAPPGGPRWQRRAHPLRNGSGSPGAAPHSTADAPGPSQTASQGSSRESSRGSSRESSRGSSRESSRGSSQGSPQDQPVRKPADRTFGRRYGEDFDSPSGREIWKNGRGGKTAPGSSSDAPSSDDSSSEGGNTGGKPPKRPWR